MLTPDIVLNKLRCFDDTNFKFNPTLHKYTYNGEQFESVTTLVSKFHIKFDLEGKSKKIADDSGFDQNWVKSIWGEKNRYANEVGTFVHEWIEDYFNQKWRELPTNPDIIHRINKFNKIYCSHLHRLVPVKFEVRVFSKKYKIAGTIDALFIYKGKLYIVDYKTNKEFRDDKHKHGRYRKLLPPFNKFYENHLNEYSIQLCTYASILEEWGIDVAGAYLVYIGPGNEDASLIKVKDMREYIKDYFDGLSIF